MWKLQPPPQKKVTPSFPATPSKSWGRVKPPFLKIWLEVQPPAERGGSAHYDLVLFVNPFVPNAHFLYPQQTSGGRESALETNGLK